MKRTLREYMKTSYEEGALGPKAFDCGSFVHNVAKDVFDIVVPETHEIVERCNVAEDIKKIEVILRGCGFDKVSEQKAGDLVAISRFNNDLIDHLGIMVDEVQFVQMNRSGPEISKINSPAYKRRIKGFYRCLQKEKT